MAFNDLFRLSAHAVITDAEQHVLLLKQAYGDGRWGLPGGAVEPGETVHATLLRECREELGTAIQIHYLSGVYYHAEFNAHALIFRAALPIDSGIQLSAEHVAWRYVPLEELSAVQRRRVQACLTFDGTVDSACF